MVPVRGGTDVEVVHQALFVATHWSVVLAIGREESTQANVALDRL